jgi:hypothetical protein
MMSTVFALGMTVRLHGARAHRRIVDYTDDTIDTVKLFDAEMIPKPYPTKQRKVIMKLVSKAHIALVLLFSFVLLWGCSDRPESTQPSADNASTDATAATIENEYLSIQDAGGDLGNAKGIFELGWQELFNPRTRTAITVGNAMAVGFDSTPDLGHRRPPAGVDMGSLYLNYGDTRLQMQKLTGPRGGTMYVSAPPPRPATPPAPGIAFVANGSYTFEVTGSEAFTAVTANLTAPPALLNITSPVEGDSMDMSGDLVITWQGGYANAGVLVTVMPGFPPPGRPEGGRGPGGGPGPGGNGVGIVGPGMPPPDSTKGIVLRLTDNPGTCTVSAAALQQLIQKSGAKSVICSVSQMAIHELDHDGGKIHLTVRDHVSTHVNVY